MNLLVISLFSTTIIFGIIAAVFSYKEERGKKELKNLKKRLSQRLYEVSILKRLSSEIGYSLNIKKVAETIISSIENLFRVTSISYAILDEDKIVLKTYIKEQTGTKFVDEVKRIIVESVCAVSDKARGFRIIDNLEGETSDLAVFPLSYFNVPLVVNNAFVGVITIASKNKNNFSSDDMTVLYKLISQATKSVEQLEEVVNTEKSKLNSMLFSIPSGAIVFLLEQEENLRLTTINSAAKQFLHIEGEPDAIKVITSFGRELNILKQIKTVLEEKKSIVVDTFNLYGKTFKIFVNPVFLEGSLRILGASITMEDLTVEKQIEEIRENFTNMVVHELRAPLTSIKGASELLLSGKLGKEDKDKMLGLINTSSQDLLDDIGQLLDAAKIDAGKFVIKKDIADLSQLIAQKADTFSLVSKQKHIDIEVSLEKQLPQFEFDKERIGQILNNLLSNAIKFTHEGGKIELTCRQEDQNVKIIVKDNGIGIPESLQTTLFTRFTQTGSSSNRAKGTGLGLYISKSIIESHGGKIWIESEETKGTTISFTLPLLHPVPIEVNHEVSQRVVN